MLEAKDKGIRSSTVNILCNLHMQDIKDILLETTGIHYKFIVTEFVSYNYDKDRAVYLVYEICKNDKNYVNEEMIEVFLDDKGVNIEFVVSSQVVVDIDYIDRLIEREIR